MTVGAFRSRAALYAALDEQLSRKTRFFLAASHTNWVFHRLLSNAESEFVLSQSTQSFLSGLSHRLEAVNVRNAYLIKEGHLTGDLDTYMVRTEQESVQEQIDAVSAQNRPLHTLFMSELNDLLRFGSLPTCFIRRSTPAALYFDVLRKVRSALGRPMHFASQRDREQIGLGLIGAIRDS